jgi:LPS-assembly protein
LKNSNTKAAVVLVALTGMLTAAPAVPGGDPAADDSDETPRIACPSRALGPAMPTAPDRSAAPIIVYARELDAAESQEGEARGNVELYRLDQHLATEHVIFHPVDETVTLPGKVDYQDSQVWLSGEDGHYRFGEESGRFSSIDYGLTGSSAQGSAESIELSGGHTSRLHALDYTTCPGEKPDWQLYARELELRHEDGMGTARGAKLTFKGVPILYSPWFTFPIDDRRKSGFLYPSLGQNSDSGLEISIPWYWNIAPNQDATLEPRYFSKRGFMLTGDYRFLTRKTSGSFDFDYMPDDRISGEERYHYVFRHRAAPWRHWKTGLTIDQVSDDRYYQDFGTGLLQTSTQFLRSSATLDGVGRYWTFELMADDFQVIDESVQPRNEPYRRVPRIGFWVDRPVADIPLFFKLDSELVYFDRDFGVTGSRLDVYPNVYWHQFSTWGFIKPSLGFRYTGYELDRQGLPGAESPSRGTSIVSLDAGLVFDRTTSRGSLQTLEPRLFYLYVPYAEQDSLPVFDTGEFTFGFSQLFNTNRFAGADRQGDANQLSLAVSTSHFDRQSGQALWTLNLGQIIYFQDQRVQLDGKQPMDENLSPFLAEFDWRLFSRFSALAGLQWDWSRDRLDVGTFGVNYRGSRGERARFEYRYRRQRVDQFDFRVFWPINETWRVLSRLNYSFADNDLLEIQGGVEYESCCWAFRTVLRRYLKNRDGDFRNGIYVELNLKGLASIGTGSRNLFVN